MYTLKVRNVCILSGQVSVHVKHYTTTEELNAMKNDG